QLKSWTSAVYSHFKPPSITQEDGKVTYTFVCKKSPSIKVTRVRHDDSTSNLVCHVKACDGGLAMARSGSITEFAQGSTYTPHKFRMKLALWVTRHHQPFAIVEDDELVEIFTDLNNKEYPGKLHLCADGWTSPNVISFIGLTVHWAEDGHIQSTILDFVKYVHNLILAFTADNASNNNTLVDELGDL
ncbi:hypothetical protein PILCRDRAFT_47678, partial [Piloderma croceum F 1598]